MKSRVVTLTVLSLLALLMSRPVHLHGQQAPEAQQHEQHHPETVAPPPTAGEAQANMMSMMARMKATNPKLDALVKKMSAARGAAKTDAIAELLTALVEDRRTNCEPMANMMSMMNMMGGNTLGGRGNRSEAAPTSPQQ